MLIFNRMVREGIIKDDHKSKGEETHQVGIWRKGKCPEIEASLGDLVGPKSGEGSIIGVRTPAVSRTM